MRHSTLTQNGQAVYIATRWFIGGSGGIDMPIAQNRSMGQTGQTLATFKLTTGAPEAVNISSIVVTDTLAGTATLATGTHYESFVVERIRRTGWFNGCIHERKRGHGCYRDLQWSCHWSLQKIMQQC